MYPYITASVIIALAFLMSIFIISMYKSGVKDGMRLAKGKEPEQFKTPVQVVREHKEKQQIQAENDRITEGLANIFSYTGDPQGGDDN